MSHPTFGRYVRVAAVAGKDHRGIAGRDLRVARGARYAKGKWSVKEVVGDLSDGERVFSYRALRFARADATDLPGFEENEWVANANFDRRTLASLVGVRSGPCRDARALRVA